MNQTDLFYSHSSVAITLALFAMIVLCNELGFRVGRFVQDSTDTEIKSLTGAVQASVLGLLALLLGFTFSMSMQRYDGRNNALIAEVNAIGTASLRVQLLPPRFREPAAKLLRDYVDLRIEVAQFDITQREQRSRYRGRVAEIQGALWQLAVEATREDPRPVTTGAFVNSLNELIDSEGRRNALLQMHVPETVMLLLFVVFLSSGGILGYSSGLTGRRIVTPTLFVSFLIAMIVFIIIDLDRPKRGLIQVDSSMLLELREQSQ